MSSGTNSSKDLDYRILHHYMSYFSLRSSELHRSYDLVGNMMVRLRLLFAKLDFWIVKVYLILMIPLLLSLTIASLLQECIGVCGSKRKQ